MPLFQLDPESIVARAKASSEPVLVPSLGASIWRGIWGFMLVGVIGFAPWAIFERWFRGMRETQLYIACTAAFIAASGPFLHRMIIGPGSLSRFYKVFAIAFLAYAGAWISCWVTLRGDAGEFFGLLAGSVAMGAVIAFAFGALWKVIAVVLALFLGNLLGYYAGAWIHGEIGHSHRYLSMILWGVSYGAGFGAGIGLAFFLSQAAARVRLGGPSRSALET
jgi:hypothetical protein